MKKISFTLLALIAIFSASAQHRSTFDDLGLSPGSYWNGANLSGGFLDGDAYFTNSYDTTYGDWSGFAYSNVPVNVDTITSGANDYYYQYNSAAGAGVYGSAAFGVCYTGSDNATIGLKGFATGRQVFGFYVTNSAYDYISMKYGDGFAKKFGGVTGTDPDWFRLTVTGWYQGTPIPDSVNVYLADFRSADTTQHYILNSWKFVNLLSLGYVDSLTFILSSDDTIGGFGMNTPAYFNMDNFMTTDGVPYTNPLAVIDSFQMQYMDTLTGNADTLVANVLANDIVDTFLRNTVSIVSGPDVLGATAYIDANNNLVYVPAASVAATDTVTYSICDEFGACSIAQVYILVTGQLINAGVINIGNTAGLFLYPNPAYTHVSVSYSSLIESISLTDISGRMVMQQSVNANKATLNIEAFSPGVYTAIIHTAEGISVERLVKE